MAGNPLWRGGARERSPVHGREDAPVTRATRRNDTAVPMLAHDVRVGCEVGIAERALLLEEIERRTGSASRELKDGRHSDSVIPHPAAQNRAHWRTFTH